MKEHHAEATLAALKVAAYGGPVAMFLTAVGSGALGVAFWDRSGEHFDVLVVLGGLGIVLGFLEWTLARRFRAHEDVERKQYERVANIADDAAQQISAMVRATREHTEAVVGFRGELAEVRGQVSALGRRVAAIEDRYMRPAMLFPSKKSGEGT